MSTLIPASSKEKFQKWYLNAFEGLYKMNAGDGAIVALMLVMPLYERYIISKVGEENKDGRETLLCEELGFLTKTHAEKFWNTFRDGLCHQGSFFVQSRLTKRKTNPLVLPRVGLGGDDHPNLPKFIVGDNGQETIFVNPWEFGRYILKKYENDPNLLESEAAPLLDLVFEVHGID